MRKNLALILAIATDGLQLIITPLIPMGGLGIILDGVIDVSMAATLILLVGFHWAFIPALLAELIPGVGLVPLWTLAVLLAGKSTQTKRAEPINVTSPQSNKDTPMLTATPVMAPTLGVKGRPQR